MKPLTDHNRRHVNIHDASFEPYVYADGMALGDSILQLDNTQPLGEGFHVYRMPAGMTTRAHRHNGVEQFLVLEGTLVDNDGRAFTKGDMVCYDDGTEHSSYSPDGCLLAVMITHTETPV
ncbi:MAG: cupin domain-containing protein [bacterium]